MADAHDAPLFVLYAADVLAAVVAITAQFVPKHDGMLHVVIDGNDAVEFNHVAAPSVL